jgi:hypothetical protein
MSFSELQREFARGVPEGLALQILRTTGAQLADGQQPLGTMVTLFQALAGADEAARDALQDAFITAQTVHADGNVESLMHTINAILIPVQWLQLYAGGLNARAAMAQFLKMHIQFKIRAETSCSGTFNKAFVAGQKARRQGKDPSEVAAVVTGVLAGLTPESKDGSRYLRVDTAVRFDTMVCDILYGIFEDELGEENDPPTKLKDILPLIRRKVKRVPPKANLADVKDQTKTAPPNIKCWHCGENHFTFTCGKLPLCDHCKINNHSTAFCDDYKAHRAKNKQRT